ncbi:alpha/beta hydrolase fold domain-containing protein [Streptomyces sp. NBC_00433]
MVSVDYRLAPHAAFPQQVHDLKGAVRWLRAHGAGLGLDTGRLAALTVVCATMRAAHPRPDRRVLLQTAGHAAAGGERSGRDEGASADRG